MTLRVVFMGTPEFSVPTLTEIAGQGHQLVAAYSRPPRPAGRGLTPKKSPVHEVAERFGITVYTPRSLRSPEEQATFAALRADVTVVVAYGLILPPPILAATSLGAWNLHASLLPRWRGAAPIERAVMAGDPETGVMVMRMEEGLDTGPVAMAEHVPIEPQTTAGDLAAILSRLGADLMVRALGALERGGLKTTPQPAGETTYAAKIDKTETRIDWSRPAAAVRGQINGLSPFPGGWCEMPIGNRVERVRLLRATSAQGRGVPGTVLDDKLLVATGEGAVRLLELQRPGGKALPADVFLRGSPVLVSTHLG